MRKAECPCRIAVVGNAAADESHGTFVGKGCPLGSRTLCSVEIEAVLRSGGSCRTSSLAWWVLICL